MAVEYTEEGNVIFLARRPGQVADQGASSGAVVVRGAKSGNAKFDPKTGRFAGGGAKNPETLAGTQNPVPTTRSGLPQGVTQEEWERRMDVVREAARKSPAVDSPEAAAQFLKDKVQDLSKVDVKQFVIDVRASLVDDLVDALQSQFKPTTKGQVKISVPRAFIKNTLTNLSDGEFDSMLRRLQGRGFTEEDIKKNIISKVRDPARKKRLEQTYGEVELTDWPDEAEITLSQPPKEPAPVKLDDSMIEAMKEIAAAMPAPIVNIPPPTGKVVKTVNRDSKGLILSVEEETRG